MLLINLDYQTRVPIYEQIVHEIERYVALGILKPKDQIPSIRELAGQLGVNPNTVKKLTIYWKVSKLLRQFQPKEHLFEKPYLT